MEAMDITTLVLGPLEVNCYLVRDRQSGLAALIDPGAEAEVIIKHCEQTGATPIYLINTHAHGDHIGANAELKDRYPEATLCIGSKDASLLSGPGAGLLSAFLGSKVRSVEPDRLLNEGDRIEVGDIVLEVLETPGHTPGSISLCARDAQGEAVVFCGDLLFAGSVGRTDLPGGDMTQLKRSIEQKIFAFPESTVIMPGHGPRTTVAREKRTNPYVGSGGRC